MSNYLVNSADLTNIADAIRAKSGGSSPLEFPTDFVSEIGSIPTGGNTLIASGTYDAGTNNPDGVNVNIGNKMPKKDFAFVIAKPDNAEFPYSASRKAVYIVVFIDGNYGYFDLTSDGNNPYISKSKTYDVNNNGTITTYTITWGADSEVYIKNESLNIENIKIDQNYLWVNRSSSGFMITLKPYSRFYGGYNWWLYYYGSDRANDIVEVSA